MSDLSDDGGVRPSIKAVRTLSLQKKKMGEGILKINYFRSWKLTNLATFRGEITES